MGDSTGTRHSAATESLWLALRRARHHFSCRRTSFRRTAVCDRDFGLLTGSFGNRSSLGARGAAGWSPMKLWWSHSSQCQFPAKHLSQIPSSCFRRQRAPRSRPVRTQSSCSADRTSRRKRSPTPVDHECDLTVVRI